METNHFKRDSSLPKYRNILLENAIKDLSADPNVLAIYLGGSLAKSNFDNYSDIDIHTIVKPDIKKNFIKEKRSRAARWGEVAFYEDANPSSPVVVTHYTCFVKIDSWYHTLEEVKPSIWLKGIKVLYDPNFVISEIIEISNQLVYELSFSEVELWKSKVLAFVHETYRAVMRKELRYANYNLDRLAWLICSGWYMEKEVHFDASYGSWSKVEGERSILNSNQLSLLKTWNGGRTFDEIMAIMVSLVPEILRLNKSLSAKVNMDRDEVKFQRILKMGY